LSWWRLSTSWARPHSSPWPQQSSSLSEQRWQCASVLATPGRSCSSWWQRCGSNTLCHHGLSRAAVAVRNPSAAASLQLLAARVSAGGGAVSATMAPAEQHYDLAHAVYAQHACCICSSLGAAHRCQVCCPVVIMFSVLVRQASCFCLGLSKVHLLVVCRGFGAGLSCGVVVVSEVLQEMPLVPVSTAVDKQRRRTCASALLALCGSDSRPAGVHVHNC
jgi:hypothetical protein